MQTSIRPLDIGYLLFLSLVWGSSFLFVAVSVETIPPLTLAAGRVVLAAAAMIVVLRAGGRRLPLEPRLWIIFLLIGLVGNALPFTLIGWGQVRIDSSLAVILISTVPLFTLMLAHLLTADDRMTPGKGAGIALGFAGVVLLLGPDVLTELGAGVWGQLAVVGGALSFAVTNMLARLLRDLHPTVISAGVLICAVFWTVPASLVVDRPWTLAPAWIGLLAACALGLISTAAANLVYFRLIARTRPTFVSLSNYLMPAVGVMWGVGLLGEAFTLRSFGALALILLGVAAAGIGARRRRPAGAPDG